MSRLSQADPPRVITLSFLALIAIGTVLLSLPIAHSAGDVSFIDALFTATSAACVTGLIVVDTGTAYTGFGQVVILLLFQIGGLGVLTFGTFLALATGRQLGFGSRLQVQAQLNTSTLGGIAQLAKSVAIVAGVTELIGAAFLYLRFGAADGVVSGAWSALFHSVSAFNNAGFSLYRDSLTRFVGDPLVNIVVITLILVGGLGFAVITELFRWARHTGPHRRPRLSLHTKIVLFVSVFLVAAGMTLLMIVEWNNPDTLGPLSTGDRVLASLFQSVTPRTAGFNTLDYGSMSNAGLVITMGLMFVGGNPGSTAGGVKTVTMFVLLITIWTVVRNKAESTAFGRRIQTGTQIRASAIAVLAAAVGGAALTMLAEFEPDMGFTSLLFETVSALGTVGVSTGITADLGTPARLVLIGVMFLGRVGLLSFAVALVQPGSRGVRYPSEDVIVG